jgi:hypothetical protein
MTREARFPTDALNGSKFPGAEFMNSTAKKGVGAEKLWAER